MQYSTVPAADGSYARYKHDCRRCIFLGYEGAADLYVCVGGVETTVIARRSDEGPDYSSGLSFAFGAIPELTAARFRAQSQDLLGYDLKLALNSCSEHSICLRSREELHEQLKRSEIGMLLAGLTGTTAPSGELQAYIDRQVVVLSEKFPDKEVDTLRDWALTPVLSARDWARRLGLPAPDRREFFAACPY